MLEDPRWLPSLRFLLHVLDLPRRKLPDTFSQLTSLPNAQLQLGEEMVPAGEKEMIENLIAVLVERHRRSYPAGVRPMLRDFHTKGHGCLLANFQIEPDLPSEYRHGVFAAPGLYRAVVRFSNGQRAVQPDQMQTPHGMAIKLFNVIDPENPTNPITQDFLLADFPINILGTVADAYEFYPIEAADNPVGYFFSLLPGRVHLRGFLVGVMSTMQVRDLFDVTYFSQTPYRLGPGSACKFIVKPSGKVAANPGGAPPPGDNYLRDQMVKRLMAAEPVSFDFLVQRQLHPVRQPVEDASVEWRTDEAPARKVATLVLDPYGCGDPFPSPWRQWCCERLSFNPNNGLPATAPIGGINRLRKVVYQQISAMRHSANGVIRREPRDENDFQSKVGW